MPAALIALLVVTSVTAAIRPLHRAEREPYVTGQARQVDSEWSPAAPRAFAVVSAVVQPVVADSQRASWPGSAVPSSDDATISVYAAQAADATARRAALAQAAQQADFMSGLLLAEEREQEERAFETRNRSVLAAEQPANVTSTAATALSTPPTGGY